MCVLGPLEVVRAGRPLPVSGSRLRRLLVRLAVDAPAAVAPSSLMAAVWPDERPAEEHNALQALVSRLRRALGETGAVQQVPGGYRLAVQPGEVDLNRFAELATQGRQRLEAGQPEPAADLLRQALGLWRGEPLFDADDADYAEPLVVRLVERQLEARADLLEARIRSGEHGQVIAELEELAATDLLRERFTGLLMTALVGTGRGPEALAAYERLRVHLADQLGVDPSPELQAQHLELLRGRPEPAGDKGVHRGNLTYQLTSFIGRDGEQDRVSALLAEHRLTTIVGPGGAGKTRLATQVADRRVTQFRDGVWIIELAPVSEVAGIEPAILDALGPRSTLLLERTRELRTAGESRDRLIDLLEGAEALVIMDNCEHLIGGVSRVVDRVLRRCPGVRVLATSREPLGIVGEALCLIPPLGLPPVGSSASEAVRYPAVQLLAERATAVNPAFRVDDPSVADVVEIVRRLDGLPLAIELAAARLRVLPVSEIARRLGDRFRLLSSGNRTAERRHQTLYAVVQWSWDLLSGPERVLAERLSVFPAGATVATATAVCADDDGAGPAAAQVPDLLDSLVDKSLLQVSDIRPVRYRMLETIREFGAERLAERGELASRRAVHARYFAELAAQLDPELRTERQLPAVAEFTAERENMLAALRFFGETGDGEAAMRVCVDLVWYWNLVGVNTDSAGWIDFALRSAADSKSQLRIYLEAAQAMSSFGVTDPGSPTDIGEAVRERRRRLGEMADRLGDLDLPNEPVALMVAPVLAFIAGDSERGERLMTQVLRVADPWMTAALHIMRANFAENEGDVERMRQEAALGLELFERVGDRWGIANALSARGQIRRYAGDIAGATADFERASQLLSEIGPTDDDLILHLRLSELRVINGDFAGAAHHLAMLRQQDSGEPASTFRRVLIRVAEANLASLQGEPRAAQLAAELRLEVSDGRVAPQFHGHLAALVTAVTASVSMAAGELVQARRDVEIAYREGITTDDLPIVATVGQTVAMLAERTGHPRIAAEILGACTRLRGASDLADPRGKALVSRLQAALGPEYQAAYDRGTGLDRQAAIDRLDPAGLDATVGDPLPDAEMPGVAGELRP